MYESRLLDKARQLSAEELQQVAIAQQKWYPAIYQTYNTSLFDMMASPYKKALITLIVYSIVVYIAFFLYRRFFGRNKSTNYYIIGSVILGIIIIYGAGVGQYKLNQNVQLVMTMAKPNATKYDYESSDVIQAQLMRKAYSRGGSSAGSGIFGGLVGYGLGRRRR